jgi:hypothetical protein
VYNYSITRTFLVAVGLSCFSIFGALLIEWKSVKKDGDNKVHEEHPSETGQYEENSEKV